ncbi:MAG: amidohydrolase family protein [Candidatus Helarchaeota archaeon]
MEIIDFHVHFWKKEFVSNGFKTFLKNFAFMANLEEFPNMDYTPEKYLQDIEPENEKDIEKYKISKAVIFPVDFSFTEIKFKISYEEYFNYILSVCEEYKGMFYSFIAPDPRHGKEALDLMDHAIKDCNFKGLLLTPSTGFSLDDENLQAMVQKAVELEVPVILHDIGLVPRPLKLVTDFIKMDELFEKFNKQLFIFSPFTQMDMDLFRVGMRHRDHLMADLSAFNASDQMVGNSMPGMFKSQSVIMIKEGFGAKKILFASDWPWFEIKAPVRDWAKEVRKLKTSLILKPFGLPNVDDDEKKLILGGNTRRVLKLD